MWKTIAWQPKSNTCNTTKTYCVAAETFAKVLIHAQSSFQCYYDTFIVKLSEYFVYMYGKRSGPLSVKYLIHVRCRKCNVPATVFVCIGCANTIFVYSTLVFVIVNELSVSPSLY